MCGFRRPATASPTSCRRPRFPKTNTRRRCSSCPPPAAPPTRLGESIRIFNTPDAAAAASLVARWPTHLAWSRFEGGRPQVFGVPATGAAPQRADQSAGGRVRVRVGAGREEPRLHHARSDARRGRAAAAGPVVRHPGGRAGPLHAPHGAAARRLDTARAHAPFTVCRRVVLVARQPRDRVFRGAAHRIHGRVRCRASTQSPSTAARRGRLSIARA